MQTVKSYPQNPLPNRLVQLLPPILTQAIASLGVSEIEEIRMHRAFETTLTSKGKNLHTGVLLGDGIDDLLRTMCRDSLYAYRQSIQEGFLSLGDGFRVGIAGTASVEQDGILGVHRVSSLVVRIPHSVPCDVSPLLQVLLHSKRSGGILLYAKPGGGKTTCLRALAELASSPAYGLRTVVVDSREELALSPSPDHLLDLLLSYPRAKGIEIAVRSLNPDLVLCDEIGNPADAEAILSACNCGVPLIATAHANSLAGLLSRPTFRRLHLFRAFENYVGLARKPGGFSYQIDSWEDADANLKMAGGSSDSLDGGLCGTLLHSV